MRLTRSGEALGLGIGLTALFALSGCGPSHLQIEPADVVAVSVRPASQQLLFCPGDPFQVELVAKMKDGTKCSNLNGEMGCLGKEDVVIDPDLVRMEASSGKAGKGFTWNPDPDPLLTANSGLLLRGWVEKDTDGKHSKSMVDEAMLKPVYQCMRENLFTIPQMASDGQHGAAGPNLRIAVTALSTPHYPNAALIRVDDGASKVYLISSAADQPVRIISRGQNGAHGAYGQRGADGAEGPPDKTNTPCTKGGQGQDGADGAAGGPGGDGGQGGQITIILDAANADKLRSRVEAVSIGGDGGPGGPGGSGGRGGRGGKGGPTASNCSDTDGPDGRPGRDGHEGQQGRRGQDGPAPTFQTGPRDALFAAELTLIKKIEATPPAK